MYQINENYQKLPGSYLFSTIAKKVKAFSGKNPDANIISLGIGDVTQPLAPAIIEAMHKAVDEMPLQKMIMRQGDAILRQMRFLYRTVQRVIPVIFRKFSA